MKEIKRGVILNYIDLFSGAGGMSLGFHLEGFKNIFAIDYEDDAVETYKFNFPNHKVLNKNIQSLKDKDILNLTQGKQVDVVIGGPPCQGFSIAGNIGRKFIEDERNYLFKEFVRIVKITTPKIFVMENVARMATHNSGQTIKEICSHFKNLGYNVQYKVLNSADYLVPQVRNRIIVVGTKNCDFKYPEKINKRISVKEAISDLPPLNNGEKSNVANHFAMNHTEQMLYKMSFIEDGGDRYQIPDAIRPKSGDVRKYIKYNSELPSITITGDMRKVFHYEQNRALSPRELARLQSFPDNFIFKGKSISIQQQIGNAVPPKLSQQIAKEVKKCLNN